VLVLGLSNAKTARKAPGGQPELLNNLSGHHI
jgi:hypothetical protein